MVPESVAACRQYARAGCVAMDRGDWNGAEQLLRQAVASNPVDHEARRQLAEVLWQRGAMEESIRQMELTFQLAPSDASVAVRAGEMELAMHRLDEALVYANQAIAIQPDLATAWALRGRIHARSGRLSQGLADLHRALTYAPSAEDVLLDLAKIHQQRGEPERCLTTIHHVIDLYPPNEAPRDALFLEGRALAQLGRFDDAACSFLAALQQGDPHPDILYQLAEVEFRRGQTAAARNAALRVLETDSDHRAARLLLDTMDRMAGIKKATQPMADHDDRNRIIMQ